jgi:hypothetical protein
MLFVNRDFLDSQSLSYKYEPLYRLTELPADKLREQRAAWSHKVVLAHHD